MAFDKVVDSAQLDAGLSKIGSAIREKTGSNNFFEFPDEMETAIKAISGGGATEWKDVNFIDYDGTLLHAYTVAEANAMTALPPLPSREGLICQGWNYDLATIKAHNRALTIGAMYITDDGKTRIYIHLEEGRTSPMLGCCPNGTVTVDWGDGSTETLTGTSTSTVKWTSKHNYAAAGDYLITLAVNGSMGFYGNSDSNGFSGLLRYSSGGDARNGVYQNAVQKIELGQGITGLGNSAFYNMRSLESISIPKSITTFDYGIFFSCYSLKCVVVPEAVKTMGNANFYNCSALTNASIPNSVTSIGHSFFYNCYALPTAILPDSVTSIGHSFFYGCYALTAAALPNGLKTIPYSIFYNCYALSSVMLPTGATSMASGIFYDCRSLPKISIPNGIPSIDASAFSGCRSLVKVNVPQRVTKIGSAAFRSCVCVVEYDFATHTAVPTLDATSAFTDIAGDCKIKVPSALYNEWIAATNWSTYASYIVAV